MFGSKYVLPKLSRTLVSFIVILVGTVSSYEIVPLQSGILFQREENIILSSHTWSVSLHFNLTEIRVGKEDLETNLREVRRTVDEYSLIAPNKNKFRDLLDSLDNVNSRLGTDLQSVIDMIPQSDQLGRRRKRRKRAFTAGGKLIKFMFGNPDENDRKKIFNNLHRLNIDHDNIVMNAQAQTLKISNTEETISKALGLLQSLSENVTDFNRKFQESMNSRQRNITLVLDRLIHENNIELALTSLVYFSIETQHAMTEFRNAIQTSLTHVLSPILIPSDVLIEILERIRGCLDKPLELIAPGTHSTVHAYYELSKVTLGVEDEELIITVTLPISDISGQFQMYKIISIPWMINKTDIFVQWEVADYFIIDESRKFHASITASQRRECEGRHITLCPFSAALYTENSPICEYSLFMGEHNPFCMKTVDKLKNNIVKSIPTAWVVSVVQQMSLTLICPGHAVFTERVEGSFLIRNATSCEILSRYFKLPRVIGHNMSIHGDFKLLAIPKIHILNEDERMQVVELSINDDLTNRIKGIIDENKRATPLASLLHKVRGYYEMPVIEPLQAFAGTISIYSVLVSVSIAVLFLKFKRHIKGSVNKGRTRDPPTNVTLQVKNFAEAPKEASV